MAAALLSSSIFPNSAANSRTNSPRTNSNVPLPRGGGILLNPIPPLAIPSVSSPFTRSPRPNGSLSLPQHSANSEYASSVSGSPHPRSATSPLPRTDSNSSSKSAIIDPASSNGNAAQSDASHSRANSIRKIRFAPLPDPRRDELAENAYMTDSPLLATSGGLSLPSSTTTDEGVSPVQQQQLPATTNANSALGLVHSAGDQPAAGSLLLPAGAQGAAFDDSGVPDDTASDYGGSSSTLRRDNTVSKPKRWSKRLFGPLLGKSASGGGSGPSIGSDGGRSAQSDDESMWRTTSRDSMASNTSNEGGMLSSLALTRRRTGSGAADSRPSKLSMGFTGGGVPMKRVQSLGTPVSKAPLAPARRRNQRMLNGRVYGAPRSTAFDNIRDTEPEFVEWGHGGAGSVKNAGLAGGKYAGVQSQGSVSVGASTTGGNVADDDDGSGMAWVKRRKEQREREKAEAAKKAAEANEDATNTPQIPMAESESGTTIQARDFVAKDGQTVEEPESVDIASVPMTTSGSSTVTPRPSGTPTGVGTPRRRESGMTITGTGVGSPLANETTISVAEDEHHVVKAVAVPVHQSHHHHTHVQHPHAHEPGRKSPPPPVGATPSEGSSVTGDEDDEDSDSSTSDDEDEDAREEDESDTEEEMGEREDNRKTSVCAGVEKISRHRDQPVPGS